MATHDDSRELRRCVRDLLALSALSAYWSQADFLTVAEGLADVTLRSVPAEFAFVRVRGLGANAMHEAGRTRAGPMESCRTEEIRKTITAHLDKDSHGLAPCISRVHDNDGLRIAVHPLGFDGDSGLLVVGSREQSFPSQTDTLLLSVVANQAAVVLQHRRAEATLRESEERFARFMQHLPGLAWIKDSQGRYVYANDAAEKAFRTRRENLYGKTDDEIFPTEIAAQFKANDRRALDGGAVQVVETLEHQDGVLHHSLVSKFAIPAPGTEPPLVGGVAIDITDRLQAEEALREADRRKDEFLATLAHEIRNPLAPIRMGLQVIKLAKDDPHTVENVRSTMERQLQQLVTLVDDLLDVSRITRGKLQLRKCRVVLADVVQSAVEAAQPFIDEFHHELTVVIPERPLYLEADPNRLAQVISNLLNNAAKYTPERGRIWLTAERQGTEVLLRVKDTGIGIPPDKLESVFEMFSQIDRPVEKGYTGLGIGLTLVRSLVEMHGGRVEVRSGGMNKGSEFAVRLPIPLEPPVAEPTPANYAESTVQLRRQRVLIVDDNKEAAEMLSIVVKMLGHEIHLAGDGLQALEIAADFLPDIVLMDLGMPRMDGYEAARRIREQPWGRQMMLVALSGWGQDEDRRRTREAGFDHHLVKPADPAELQKLLMETSGSPLHMRAAQR